MSKFIAKARTILGGFFAIGDHAVTIEAVTDELSRPNESWKDQTPQLKVTFRNTKGVLSHWYNLKGFKKANLVENPELKAPRGFEYRQAMGKDGNGIGDFYLVQKSTGKRVEDPASTQIAEEIFCGLAADAGVEDGEEFDPADLVGAAVGIRVRERATGGVEVHYTMPASKVKVAEEIAE